MDNFQNQIALITRVIDCCHGYVVCSSFCLENLLRDVNKSFNRLGRCSMSQIPDFELGFL